MRELVLAPEQVIVPFEYLLGSENVLKLYFRIVKAGSGDVLPPIVVARPGHSDRAFILGRSVNQTGAESFFADIDRLVAERGALYLLDGNHRGVAATLCRRKLSALEVESDDDLLELEAMVERGDYLELPDFPFDYFEEGWVATKLAALVTRLEERHQDREILTLAERTRRLADERQVPDYMVRWYRSLRRGR